MASVSVKKCPDYEEGHIEEAVGEAVSLIGGLERIIRPGDKVLLKVNLLAPSDPAEAVTTHPSVVKAVARLVLEAGGVPIAADSPGYFFAGGKCRAVKACGIREVGDSLGIKTTQFEHLENPFVEVDVPAGELIKKVFAARLAIEADVIISLPKIKTHVSTWYTGAIKNMFGAVATRTRKEAHRLSTYEKFSTAIVDIFSVFKPGMTVMDAVVGMEGAGPRHGRKKQLGLILASRDCVALDTVSSALIGFDPLDILSIRYAAERGLGVGELGAIDILGEQFEDVAVDFVKPSGRRVGLPPMLMKIADRLIRVRPEVSPDACDGCAICARSCPVDAISMSSLPTIDRGQCIECFCCNELCPTGAMEIGRNWVARRIG